MPNTIIPRPPYQKRPAPAQYQAGFFNTEHDNIARSLFRTKSRTVATDTTLSATDWLVLVDATDGPVTVTLLPPAQAHDWMGAIKKIDASANAVTLSGTIDGAADPTLTTQYDAVLIQSDGAAYYQLASV